MAGGGKPGIELLFGAGPKGPAMGPDADFKVLAHQVLDTSTPMAARVDALHELIHTCIQEAKSAEESEEAADPAEGESDHGGY